MAKKLSRYSCAVLDAYQVQNVGVNYRKIPKKWKCSMEMLSHMLPNGIASGHITIKVEPEGWLHAGRWEDCTKVLLGESDGEEMSHSCFTCKKRERCETDSKTHWCIHYDEKDHELDI